ncbi:hypothetical protein A1Q2_08401 [Trichosporon asahii var. asahii CBS 8904]|uniref:Uncharacterized protein n=1 Tax=Trichosporon asahii var. asahii (strain CBS 8904) TaxID=1220162 RepID=K1VE48_TRIAC|nr:hypothetical protein A1Q2_08401 [Trichosporon asahii var. asahii CBS 8904]
MRQPTHDGLDEEAGVRHPVRPERIDSHSAGSTTLPAPSASPTLAEERSAAGTLVAIGYQTYAYEKLLEAQRENAEVVLPTFDDTALALYTSHREDLPPRQLYYPEENYAASRHHDGRHGVYTHHDDDYGASARHDRGTYSEGSSRTVPYEVWDKRDRSQFPQLAPLPESHSHNDGQYRYSSPPPRRDPFHLRGDTYSDGRRSAKLAPLPSLPQLGPMPSFVQPKQSRHDREPRHTYKRHEDQWRERRRDRAAPYPLPNYPAYRSDNEAGHYVDHRHQQNYEHQPPLQPPNWPPPEEYHAPGTASHHHTMPAPNAHATEYGQPAQQYFQQQIDNIHPALLPPNMPAAAPSKRGRSWKIPPAPTRGKAPARGKGATRGKAPTRKNPPRGKGKQKETTPQPEPERPVRSPSVTEIPDSPAAEAVEAPKQVAATKGNVDTVGEGTDAGDDGQVDDVVIAMSSTEGKTGQEASGKNGPEPDAAEYSVEGKTDGRASMTESTDVVASPTPQSMW